MTRFLAVRWWRPLILTLGCLLLIITCNHSNATPTNAASNSSGTGSIPAAQKTLKVATDPTFAPFEFQGPDGIIQGFDIDLINSIGQAAGFKVELQSMPFDGTIAALQASSVDAVISGMTITEERLKTLDFSKPYIRAGLAIAIQETNKSITKFADLNNKKIAVQIGTTGANEAQKIPGAQISTFKTPSLALQELANGNVDAVINDYPVTLYAIQTGGLQGIKIIGDLLTEEYYGIAVPKNSPNLQLINKGLDAINQDGTYAQIYKKWFRVAPDKLPNKTSILIIIIDALPALLLGAVVTLKLALISSVLGMLGGSLIGIIRLSPIRPLRWLARVYIDFFRGTPLLVQIFMIYFGIPALFQQGFGITLRWDRFAAAVLALSLNSSAYIAEIVRAGIQSIEMGQSEASQSLGLSSVQTMRYVIFPQALRRMLPPLGNEFITMLKDTSLVAVISFEELFYRGQLIVANNFRAFEIYTAVALIYLVLTVVSSQVFSFLEHWMNPVSRSQKKATKTDQQ